MAGWNYRVLRRSFSKAQRVDTGEDIFIPTEYGVYEVYYNDEGNPDSSTENPVSPGGETPEEFLRSFSDYQCAFSKPVLDWDTYEELGLLRELIKNRNS